MPLFGVENKLAVNRLPLITSLCEEQAAEAAVSGSSARKAPQGEATERLTILCRQREACIKGNESHFHRFVTVRCETGEACPKGKP